MTEKRTLSDPQWVEKSANEWSFTLPTESPNVIGRAVKSGKNGIWFWEAFPYQGRWGFTDDLQKAKAEVEMNYTPLS